MNLETERARIQRELEIFSEAYRLEIAEATKTLHRTAAKHAQTSAYLNLMNNIPIVTESYNNAVLAVQVNLMHMHNLLEGSNPFTQKDFETIVRKSTVIHKSDFAAELRSIAVAFKNNIRSRLTKQYDPILDTVKLKLVSLSDENIKVGYKILSFLKSKHARLKALPVILLGIITAVCAQSALSQKSMT